jgi:nucleotide-binding universal stress UspA family protein
MIPQIKQILYTTDLGEHTRPVFRYAISLAQRYSAQITMLHVLEPLGSYGMALLETYIPKEMSEQLHQQTLDKVRLQMQQRVSKFCAEELHLTTAESHLIAGIVVVEGNPAQTIVAQAQACQADLIVMGTHSYSPLGEMLIGSTARRVTQISPVPVLVVPMSVNR